MKSLQTGSMIQILAMKSTETFRFDLSINKPLFGQEINPKILPLKFGSYLYFLLSLSFKGG